MKSLKKLNWKMPKLPNLPKLPSMPKLQEIKQLQLSHLRRSIGFKLFVMFLVSIVLCSALVGAVSYRIASNSIEQKVGDNAVQVTEGAAAELNQWLEQMEVQYRQSLTFMISNKYTTKDRNKVLPELPEDVESYKFALQQVNELKAQQEKLTEEMRKTTDTDKRKLMQDDLTRTIIGLNKYQKEVKDLNPDLVTLDSNIKNYLNSIGLANADMIYGASILRLNGEHAAFASTSKIKEDAFNQAWVEETIKQKGKALFINPQKGSLVFQDPNASILAIAQAVLSPDEGQWADVIVMEFKVNYLSELIKPITYGGIGEIHLIGKEGQTLYSNHNGVPIGEPTTLNWKSEQTKLEADIYGEPHKIFVQKVNNEKLPMTIIGAIPVDKLLEDARNIQKAIFLLMIGAAFLAVLLGWWGYRSLGKPLIYAQNIMKRAEEGDLNAKLGFTRQDEIGNVGGSFDRVIEFIRQMVLQTREAANKLLESTDRISGYTNDSSTASKEISIAMEEVASGSTVLAKDAEQSNILAVQLHEQLNEVQNRNQKMREASEQLELQSKNGAGSMELLAEKNKNVEAIVTKIMERISTLHASTGSINKILDILNNISKQINMLSLNAAIVAASSGEAGKAFRVVADEIRSLANQSNKSIHSVSEVIDRIMQEMEDTRSIVQTSVPIFKEQMESANYSRTIFYEMEQSMQSFKESFEQVWHSLQNSMDAQQELSSVMMQVSAISEESSATTEHVFNLVSKQHENSEHLVQMGKDLEKMAHSLTDSLKVFKI